VFGLGPAIRINVVSVLSGLDDLPIRLPRTYPKRLGLRLPDIEVKFCGNYCSFAYSARA
jgi:hypothetical protein